MSKWWSLGYNILVFLAPSLSSSPPRGLPLGDPSLLGPLPTCSGPGALASITVSLWWQVPGSWSYWRRREREAKSSSPPAPLSGEGATLKAETAGGREADSLSVLGHNCLDRFPGSRAPAVICTTWAFVSRRKAAVRYLIRKAWSRASWEEAPLRILPVFSPSPWSPSSQTLFRDPFSQAAGQPAW